MAVVQISRIQQRRGKKNTQTGFPQLASGEIGWAIDTQELYIGNGAVSEGAPYVGNTQILTEHVNILDFIGAYQYQRNNPVIQTGPTFQTPIKRTIQERLDDNVSIKAFGAVGNGIIDDTAAIQRAIDQLFLNDATKNSFTSRVTLYFEPGEYVISEELRIPPYVRFIGSGIDSTVIHMTGSSASGAMMRMVDSNSSPGNYTEFASMDYYKRPKYINIEAMTLQTDLEEPIVILDNTDSTFFRDVKFLGAYVNGTSPVGTDPLDTTFQTGIYSRSASGVFRPENVQFQSCIFMKTGWGFYNDSDTNFLSFSECSFYQLFDGITIGGEVYGAVNTKVINCHFDLIDRYGYYIKLGFGNTSINNKYMLVGNNNEGYANATYPIIKFDTPNNQSSNDYFERNSKLKDQVIYGLIPFEPNIKTTSLVVDTTNFVKVLETTSTVPIEFFRFPLYESSTFFIDYVIKKNTVGTAIRTGKIHITVNFQDLNYHIQDEFSYTGSATVENITFSAALEDYNGDTVKDTLVLRMWNPTGNGIGNMNYTYRTMTI